ncbi:hypothetical protein ACFOWX_00975 [Sphingorhabdus arenilitoris]|uniref:Phosphoribosyl-AMP cyclohydrolase n=1 Tax=Sphingorhabdus arenilitoris TaxID=1490041 RepID=A0ABV8RC49_9SPHN
MTKLKLKTMAFAAFLPLAAMASPVAAKEKAASTAVAAMVAPTYAPITKAEVEAAQQAWGNALVAIATEYDTKGFAAAKKLAESVVDGAYGYQMGPVLFKPTLAAPPQTFRTDREGAVAYFVGSSDRFKGDGGFAIKGWRGFEINNAGILLMGNSATSMGNVTVIDSKGNRTMVDKTWSYVRGPDGGLRIVVHHSSLPYTAN